MEDKAVLKETERLQIITDIVSDIIFEYDIDNDSMMNAVGKDGNYLKKQYIENYSENMKQYIHVEDHRIFDMFVKQMRSRQSEIQAEMRVLKKNGKYVWASVRGQSGITKDGKPYVVGAINELGNQKSERQIMLEKMQLDVTTKVLNREYTRSNIEECLQNKTQSEGAFILFDIKSFKKLSDMIGQMVSEEILAEIANRIKRAFRVTDIVGRIGGDLFVVYAPLMEAKDVRQKVSLLIDDMKNIYISETFRIEVDMLAGVAFSSTDGQDYDSLLEKAMDALRYAKQCSDSKCVIYESSIKENIQKDWINDKRNLEFEFQTTQDVMEEETQIKAFAFELSEYAFQLMEQTKDVNTTMNVLIHKIGNEMGLKAIVVREVISDVQHILKVKYAWCDESTVLDFEKESEYTEYEWHFLLDKCKSGIHIITRHEPRNGEKDEWYFKAIEYQQILQVPLYYKKNLIGTIEFVDAQIPKKTQNLRIEIVKLIGRIISSYLLNTMAFGDATRVARNIKERDSITSLYQYDKFISYMKEILPEELKHNNVAIVYSDIRHFKFINDTYGYSVGDEVLRKFAQILTENGEITLCMSRIHADHFISAARIDRDIPVEQIKQGVNRVNEEIIKGLEEQFLDTKQQVNTGIYIMEHPSENIEDAISNANFARKHAKENKLSECVVYSSEQSEQLKRELKLISDLPEAISNGELVVYYQPKIECGTTRIVGAEALIRWKKPNGTFVYPDQFIPAFEKNGCVVDVDYFVYREVFAYLRECIDQKKVTVPISMNVSRVHLEDHKLIEYIKELFEEYQIPTELVEFELTENVYIENMTRTTEIIDEMRELGVKVSMDDFGSGYSSLNVLNKLPIDVLKLDRVFMKNDILEENDRIIINCIIEMAKKLHIVVLCEGIETVEQSRFLSRVGCDILQGYLYARPMAKEQFEQFAKEHVATEVEEIHFPLDGTLKDTTGQYEGEIYGEGVCFKDNVLENRSVLYFPGGATGNNIVEFPPEMLVNDSFTISLWLKAEKLNLWSSVIYTSFRNGFNSVIPRGWDLKMMFRIKDETKLDEWSDAGSSKTIKEDVWTHITVTFNSKNRVSVIYFNGQRTGMKDENPILRMAERFILGGDIYKKGFQGYIADMKIYDQPLSEIDIHSIYRKERGLYQNDETHCC